MSGRTELLSTDLKEETQDQVRKILKEYGRETLQADIRQAIARLQATEYTLELSPQQRIFLSFPLQHDLRFNFSAQSEIRTNDYESHPGVYLYLRYGITYHQTEEAWWRSQPHDPHLLAELERVFYVGRRIDSSGAWHATYQRQGLVTPLAESLSLLINDALHKSHFHRGKQVTDSISDVSFYSDSEGNTKRNNFTKLIALLLGYQKETGTSTYTKNYKSLWQVIKEWL